ncbi:GNAT family N-acetyltransferase [Streptomyces sp. NBC_00335]|uniref:GNAT family N-acetyltransferase n=1 Tax=unclassified Streptomyces TaxID=2593676 RepID=UPI00225751E1|nr:MULTISPECIES: GNAT family N-acetyltransferase [unclassified Streptomyces]MCX5403940.1 GNAT family N-acetyltransferase [Streptomyces sp. NBC_00086]
MTWTFTPDLASWLAAVRPSVAAQPVPNTQLVTVIDALERQGLDAFGSEPPFFGAWTGPDGLVAGAVVQCPPHPLLIGALPGEAVLELGTALAREPLLAGVDALNARREDARELAVSWGKPTEVVEENRLYRLAGLIAPDPVPAGRARPAGEADLPLLLEWVTAFRQESGEGGAASEAALRDRLSYGGMLLWEDAGVPVSLAGFFRPIDAVTRIGPVYTPPELRGRGYAAGVTYAATEAAHAAGAAEVLLFTDLANPTSNGVYQRLGYTPVEDRVEVALT